MAEEKIAERIDANLLNVNIQDIASLPKVMFDGKINNLAKKTEGRLIIKEYPTASAHSGHFRALLNELALKKSFKLILFSLITLIYALPPAISRVALSIHIHILRVLQKNLEDLLVKQTSLSYLLHRPLVQVMAGSDVDLTDTSESFGLPATADIMFALISTEELEGMNQIMVKQLKNRYNDPTINKKILRGY